MPQFWLFVAQVLCQSRWCICSMVRAERWGGVPAYLSCDSADSPPSTEMLEVMNNIRGIGCTWSWDMILTPTMSCEGVHISISAVWYYWSTWVQHRFRVTTSRRWASSLREGKRLLTLLCSRELVRQVLWMKTVTRSVAFGSQAHSLWLYSRKKGKDELQESEAYLLCRLLQGTAGASLWSLKSTQIKWKLITIVQMVTLYLEDIQSMYSSQIYQSILDNRHYLMLKPEGTMYKPHPFFWKHWRCWWTHTCEMEPWWDTQCISTSTHTRQADLWWPPFTVLFIREGIWGEVCTSGSFPGHWGHIWYHFWVHAQCSQTECDGI